MTKAPEKSEINPLCLKCLRPCKQTKETLLLDCPRFRPRPFKVEEYRYDQLDLFGQDPEKD